jgi:hypothetical protein
MTQLVGIRLGARPEAWAALGFDMSDGVLPLANGAIVLDEDVTGIGSLVVDRGVAGIVDGLTFEVDTDLVVARDSDGAVAGELDHVVVMTNSLERTSAEIDAMLGLECRRIRETHEVRQAFHRFADPPDGSARGCILELVENQRVPHPAFWGLVITVDDLDALCDANPELIAPPKPAVQPGRLIASARREADLGTAVAFMTP